MEPRVLLDGSGTLGLAELIIRPSYAAASVATDPAAASAATLTTTAQTAGASNGSASLLDLLAVDLAVQPMRPAPTNTTLYWDPGQHGPTQGINATGGTGPWDLTHNYWYCPMYGMDGPWINADNNTAVFGGSAGTYTVTLSTSVTAAAISFNTANYTIAPGQGNTVTVSPSSGSSVVTTSSGCTATIAAVIAGTGSGPLVVAGSGTLTLTAANTYGNGTTINSGSTLQLGSSGTTGSITTSVIDNGTLAFNRSDSPTFSYAVTGNGSVTQSGSGVLTLSDADNSYSNGTIVNAGTLAISNSGELGSGNLTLNGGTLQATAAGTFGEAVTLGASGGTVDTYGNNVTLSGIINGPGSLTKTGSGTLGLAAANTYSAGTTINGGTLQLGASGALPSGTALTVASAATLDIAGSGVSVASLAGGAPSRAWAARLPSTARAQGPTAARSTMSASTIRAAAR